MNIPMINTIPIINARIVQRPMPEPMRRSATTSPPPMLKNTVEKNLPPMKSIMTMEVVLRVAKADSLRTVRFNFLLKKARTKEPRAPKPACA